MVCFAKGASWKKTLPLSRLFPMQLSQIKNRSAAEFGEANHFSYLKGHPGRQKKGCTINPLWWAYEPWQRTGLRRTVFG